MSDEQLGDNLETWEAWTQIHVGIRLLRRRILPRRTQSDRLRDYELAEVGPVDGQVAAPPAVPLRAGHACPGRAWVRRSPAPTSARPRSTRRGRSRPRWGSTRASSCRTCTTCRTTSTGSSTSSTRRAASWAGCPTSAAGRTSSAHFVKPGGIFYVTEIHPVVEVFDDEGVAPGELRLHYPYWEHPEPLTFEVEGSYADRAAPTDGLVEHGWDHSLGEIVTALIDAGLRIDLLHEFDFVDWELAMAGQGRGRQVATARRAGPAAAVLLAQGVQTGLATRDARWRRKGGC